MIEIHNVWVPIAGLFGIVAGYGAHAVTNAIRIASAHRSARQMREDAERESAAMLREAKLQAKDELIRIREKFEDETKQRRQEILGQDERLSHRENHLERKLTQLEERETLLEKKFEESRQLREDVRGQQEDLKRLFQEEREVIQRVAEMSQEEARTMLMNKLEEDLRAEQGALIRRVQEDTHEHAEAEARRIITIAIERYAADQINDITTSAVSLPGDEMKGRIIGKEGRNIRSLEAVTGVNFMIDDTPEVVVISSFDPLRREVARLTLERLIQDGRINPARIEEVAEKVREEIEETIRDAGEKAIIELALRGVAPEIVRTLGALKYRHSYTQNVLQHSLEVGHFMGLMAAEMKLDVALARRIGLFHDIGKAVTHEVEGSHAVIGADVLKRNGELPLVCNAVAAHHGDVPGESVYAPLTIAADAMTASRPGARTETTDLYLKRLKQLETIANSFRGVVKSFAIQAGREIRVIVEPCKIDDHEAMQMARNISKQVEHDVQYPGQIKVTVVRETRCVEYAR